MSIRTNRKGLTITNDESYIYLTARGITDSKGKQLQFITDYTPELFELIADSRISWVFEIYDKKKKRPYLRADIRNGDTTVKIHISRFVMGYFLFGLNSQNIIEKAKEVNAHFNENELDCEHLYADERNCTIANLSTALKKHNGYKSRLLDGQFNYTCFPVIIHKADEYRAVIYQTGGFVYPAFDIKAHSLLELTDKLYGILEKVKPIKKKLPREQQRVCTNYWILQKYLYEHYDDENFADSIGLMIATGNFCVIKKTSIEKSNIFKSNIKINN